jgi:hypothetical protein
MEAETRTPSQLAAIHRAAGPDGRVAPVVHLLGGGPRSGGGFTLFGRDA